jgi:hypothetical protein
MTFDSLFGVLPLHRPCNQLVLDFHFRVVPVVELGFFNYSIIAHESLL